MNTPGEGALCRLCDSDTVYKWLKLLTYLLTYFLRCVPYAFWQFNTRAQLLLRWPCNVAQLECWKDGVLQFFCEKLEEKRTSAVINHVVPNSGIFWPHFCRIISWVYSTALEWLSHSSKSANLTVPDYNVLLLIRYTTLWPWPLTVDLEHLQCIGCHVVKLCIRFERNRTIRGGVITI